MLGVALTKDALPLWIHLSLMNKCPLDGRAVAFGADVPRTAQSASARRRRQWAWKVRRTGYLPPRVLLVMSLSHKTVRTPQIPHELG